MRAVVLALLVGCYSPTAPVGLPCASSGACPAGQTCDPRTDRCVFPGATIDDAAKDAPASDARTDAPSDAPNLSGCSDGEREAFTNIATYPKIAGCAAGWPGTPSMRAPAAGAACGDDLGVCAVPASACALGWHVCATSGAFTELAAISADECHGAAASGRFVAASSHCTSMAVCEYGATLPCFDSGFCSEPVCCGPACYQSPGCPDGVWSAGTWTSAPSSDGCGAQPSAQDLGVLCCLD
jgi:hypothetical protein